MWGPQGHELIGIFFTTSELGFAPVRWVEPFVMITFEYFFFVKPSIDDFDVILQAFAPKG